MKKIYTILIVSSLFVFSSVASALTKPGPEAKVENLSYEFYLYYDKGQLFADRDYELKFDVVNETFTPETVNEQIAFKAEIYNFKSELVKTFTFDPKKGVSSFTNGKIIIKGPYVSDGLRVQFYNEQGSQLISIFVNAGSICNDDGDCNSAGGENENTCANDCKVPRATPTPLIIDEPTGFLGDFDMNTILIYVVGTMGVIVISWLGWKWWKKKREESFLPPQQAPQVDRMPPPPPMPPIG